LVRLLEPIRIAKPDVRAYQAPSSEMCRTPSEYPHIETTVLRPRIPNAVGKAAAR